jgi:hypothetical protein
MQIMNGYGIKIATASNYFRICSNWWAMFIYIPVVYLLSDKKLTFNVKGNKMLENEGI